MRPLRVSCYTCSPVILVLLLSLFSCYPCSPVIPVVRLQEAVLARRRDARLLEEQAQENKCQEETRHRRLNEIRRQADQVKTRLRDEAAIDAKEEEKVDLTCRIKI